MKNTLTLLSQVSALTLATGLLAGVANGQGMGGGGGFNTGSGGFNQGGFNQQQQQGGSSVGRSSGGNSGRSSSLFNSGSGSSSSLFNSGSSTNGNSSSGGNSGGNGAGGAGTGNAQTTIETGRLGDATPITRGRAIERNASSEYLITSNPDLVGGQPMSGNNQFANLFSQIGRQINQGGNFNQQGGRNARASASAIRVPLRIGFAPKPLAGPQVTARFESRIANLNGLTAIGPIRVTMEGSTAILTGVVASEQDREVAEGVAMLEPEVGSVRNELTVQASEPGAEGANSPSNIP